MTELIGRKGLKEAQPDKIDQYAAQCAGVASFPMTGCMQNWITGMKKLLTRSKCL
jgi:hypothetical protein